MLTQKKIAQVLGLSCATVTNILNEKPGLRYSQQTRERVLATAKEMGYQPNRSWQAVRRGRSNLIGIITLGMAQEISRKAAAFLPLEINAAGYDYLVIDLHWHGGNISRVMEELVKARVEGVIICFMTEAFTEESLAPLKRAGIPIVAVDGDAALGVPIIWNDIRSAYENMTRHLLAQGHRRLVMVAGAAREARPVRERVDGFRAALEHVGPCTSLDGEAFLAQWEALASQPCNTPSGTIIHLDFKLQAHNATRLLYEFSKRLFKHSTLPDALLCSNDAACFGVYGAALEMGIPIPDAMALTGADDDAFGAMPAFGLSTIHINVEEACRSALHLLFHNIANRKHPRLEGATLPADLVLRTSCRSASHETAPSPAAHRAGHLPAGGARPGHAPAR